MRAAMLPGTFNTNSCPTLSDPSQLPAWAGPLTSPCNCAATWCSSSQALTGMRLDSRKRHVAQATEAQDRAQQHRPSPPGPSSAGPSAHSSKLVVPGCRSCCGAQRYKITHTHTHQCLTRPCANAFLVHGCHLRFDLHCSSQLTAGRFVCRTLLSWEGALHDHCPNAEPGVDRSNPAHYPTWLSVCK